MSKNNNDHTQKSENGMVRGLENRHVQLIAIAGTIGTGLFLGAGRSISLTGPSIVLVYAITGAFMFFMMRAIGEMLYQDPNQHTFINFITKYLGPGWGFFSTLSYWISLIFIGMAEITAVGEYVQFWFPEWPSWIIQIVFFSYPKFYQLNCCKSIRRNRVLVCYDKSYCNSWFNSNRYLYGIDKL